MSHSNPYERHSLGYDLQNLSQSEVYELEELMQDSSISEMDLEEALQRVRLKYLWLVAGVYLLVGLAGITLFVTSCFLGPEFKKMSDWILSSIFFVVSILLTFSGIGLGLKKPWGRSLAKFTSKLILLAFPFGTIFGLFALSTISSCDPEFESFNL